MVVVVNGRFLTQPRTGVQRFAEGILGGLVDAGYDVRIVVPSSSPVLAEYREFAVTNIGRLTGHFWEQVELPGYLVGLGRPLLLNLSNSGPICYRNQVATHHDISYVRHPESYSPGFRRFYRVVSPLLLRRSKHILTVSDFSRNEIAGHYGVPLQKITVVPNAVAASFSRGGGETRDSTVERSLPYILTVSSPAAHKNFKALLEALSAIPVGRRPNLKVVGSAAKTLVGHAFDGLEGVEFLGRVDDEQLIGLYTGASAFVFPSLYEGFGIPPLEAQAAGVPVLSSNTASMPEVLGNSAYFFDPRSVPSMTEAIQTALADESLLASLRELGNANLERFSWSRSASRVRRVLDELA